MKKIILNSIFILILSVIIHNLYSLLPNFLTLVIAPINESIAEHIKLIFSSYILLLILKTLFTKEKPNIFSFYITSIFNIIIFLIIYLPIYYIFGENLVVTLTLYSITIIISNIFKEKIKPKKNLNKLSIILIIITYLIFTLFSYFPPSINIFIDKPNNMIGLKKIYK